MSGKTLLTALETVALVLIFPLLTIFLCFLFFALDMSIFIVLWILLSVGVITIVILPKTIPFFLIEIALIAAFLATDVKSVLRNLKGVISFAFSPLAPQYKGIFLREDNRPFILEMMGSRIRHNIEILFGQPHKEF